MPPPFDDHPGLWFVAATLLPLASFVILLLAGALRTALRAHRENNPLAGSLYQLLGGDVPGKGAAYVATAAIGLAFVCSLIGGVQYLAGAGELHKDIHRHEHKVRELRHRFDHGEAKVDDVKAAEAELLQLESQWAGSVTWAALSTDRLKAVNDDQQGTVLRVGFYIDHLSVVMFLMVTLVSTLIFIFSIGYMSEELQETVEDHEVHTDRGHLRRRGRFGRFFLYLSLFCFSMLNLILADNLFQVFLSWELVGICSYLLIGHYFERTSASNAANKAFITNRIGDAGFIVGLLILWTYVGTLNFQDIFKRIRSPEVGQIEHKESKLEYAHQIVRAEIKELDYADFKNVKFLVVSEPGDPITLGTQVVLFPREPDSHFSGMGPGGREKQKYFEHPPPDRYGSMPYWLLVAAGLGVFLGCVGKSAQFPLQVWLPDAMEGPTPVSALIHAATMVAAGVYLVGRCFPLFTAEALLVIAYTGAITLFIAATIAVVQTDIKKVLAYSTVSQLGYMMLGLGVGGWVAGLFHLLTHAFFKALLFLGSGSVIYGCHHQQDMMKMGGLYPKMKITALTMLIGCLAIAGIPLFSGWYSKDAIVAQAYGFASVHPEHFLLLLAPLLTAGLTAFYMFRMWFMTFAGEPRDHHVYEHAKESPLVMTVPLMVLAVFSVVVAWPNPLHHPLMDAEASELEHTIHHAQPMSVLADFGQVPGVDTPTDIPFKPQDRSERYQAHENHHLAGFLAMGVVIVGIAFAAMMYYYRVLDPAEAKEQFAGVHSFLAHKWYFDELYSVLLVRPALTVASWFRAFDARAIDGVVDNTGRFTVWASKTSGGCDRNFVDGLVNLIARVSYAVGSWLRTVQTGYIRSYVLFLVLAAVGIWLLLMYFFAPGRAGGP